VPEQGNDRYSGYVFLDVRIVKVILFIVNSEQQTHARSCHLCAAKLTHYFTLGLHFTTEFHTMVEQSCIQHVDVLILSLRQKLLMIEFFEVL